MIALVGAFNQEEALVGAFSIIVETDCETDGLFIRGTNKMISKCDGDAFFEKCSSEFGSPNLKRPP